MSAPAQVPTSEQQLLLYLLRPKQDEATANQINELMQKRIDWELFFKLALYHRVYATVSNRLDTKYSAVIAPAQRTLFLEETADVQRKAMMRLAEMFRLQQSLKQLKIPFLFFNGPVTALSVYKNLNLRGFKDMDLLVRKQDLPIAAKALEQCSYKAVLPEIMSRCLFDQIRQSGSDVLADLLCQSDFVGRNQAAIVDLHWKGVLPGVLDTVD